MKALKLSEPRGTLALVDTDVPTPGPGEVLIHVEASGLCYTDVHICDDDWEIVNAMVKRDLTLGHEAVGVITALGDGVTDLAVGQRVAAWFLRSACGTCKSCRRGDENLCLTPTLIGLSHDGSHAEYVTAVADFVVPVPDGVSSVQAAPLACAGMSVLGALRNADVSLGTTFAVIGVGGQGHLAVQIAKAMGATVVALDIGSQKLALARELGADHVFDVTDPDTLGAAAALGIDVVMVAAPSHDAHRLGLAIVANGGTISLCAVPGGETPISMTLCAFKGLRLLTQAVATRRELADVLAMAAAGKLTCAVESRPLTDAVESVAQLRDGGIVGRIVFVP